MERHWCVVNTELHKDLCDLRLVWMLPLTKDFLFYAHSYYHSVLEKILICRSICLQAHIFFFLLNEYEVTFDKFFIDLERLNIHR